MQKKHTASLVFLILIGIVLFAVVILLLGDKLKIRPQLDKNSEQTTVTQIPTPSPESDSQKRTYQNNIFSFNYDPALKIKDSSESGISWWDPNGKFWMELNWQNNPFPKFPEVSANSNDVRIDKDQEISVSKNKVRDLIYSCGADCYFHELQIHSDDQFYRLKASIAPEGQLEGKFQQIITSIKFTQ